jgi:serine/threonine protein kinase
VNNASAQHTIGGIIGTPAYIAPEILSANEPQYNTSTDMYAFAILMNEMLSGVIPFGGLTFPQICMKLSLSEGNRPQLFGDVYHAERTGDGVTMELQVLIQRGWHSDYLKRPPFNKLCSQFRKLLSAVGGDPRRQPRLKHSPRSPVKSPQASHFTPLSSLSVAEVGTVLDHIHMSLFVESFNTHQVSGLILSLCESVDELMSIGVTTVMHARGLLVKIKLWNECGVDNQLLQVYTTTSTSTTPVYSPHMSNTTTTTAPLTQSIVVPRVEAVIVATSVEEAVLFATRAARTARNVQSPVTCSFIHNDENGTYIGEPWVDGSIVFGIGFVSSVSEFVEGEKVPFRYEGQWFNGKLCGHGVCYKCRSGLELDMSIFNDVYPESGYLIFLNMSSNIGNIDHKLLMNGYGRRVIKLVEEVFFKSII